MATVVNARDVILQAALPNGRVAGVTMQPNIVVDPSQVTGLGLIIDGTRLIDFESSAQVFQVNTAGTATPSSITLTVNFRNVTGTPSLTVTSGTLTSTPTLSGGPSVYTATLPYANMTTDAVTIRASVTYNSVTYTDDLTIVKARDGQYAVNAFLTNESHTVPSSDTGVVSSYTGAGGTFKVYQGSTDVSASATYAVQSNPNSLTTSINSTTGVFSVTGGFGTGIDTATVTYRATYGGQTYDKVFTITKSKAGTAGAAGQRGSRTFYVSGQSSWSDAVATSAASVSGGPIVNDVVTEYNTTSFSQTRFWNGSSWLVVNGVVDGNLLVSGTVGAAAITTGAIRASHLLVTGGQGGALNADTTCTDPTAWPVTSVPANLSFVTVSDGLAGDRAIQLSDANWVNSLQFPIVAGRTYRLHAVARRLSGTGTSYMRLRMFSYTGALVSYIVTEIEGAANFEGVTVPTSWTRYVGYAQAPATAVSCLIELYGNYGGTGATQFQDVRCEEQIDYSMIVLGGLRADRIDTRNLTIKDAAGNVVFSSGTESSYRPFRMASTANTFISGSSATKLSGGSGWDASVYSLDGYTNGAYATAVAAANTMFGLNSDPTTNASYQTIDYAIHCQTASNLLYYYENNVGNSLGATWADGDTLTVTYDGANVRYLKNGTVLRTVPTTADRTFYFDSSILDVGNTMSGMQFGPYGHPSAVSPTNQINSTNVSTFIAAAAIGNLQIGNYIASNNFNGTIDGSGNITADGTTGWAISKSGYAVFSNVKVRGDVQANTVIQGAVTTNTSASSSYSFYQLPNTAVTNFTQNVSGGSITCAGGYMFCVMSVGIEAHVTNSAITSIRLNVQPKINGTNYGIEFQAWMPVTAYTDANGNTRLVGAQIPVIFNAGTRTGAQAVTFDCKATYYAGSSTANAGGADGTSSYLFIGWQGFLLETRG